MVRLVDMATGSEAIFATGARGRIVNADETHNKFSNEGDCGGGSRGKGGTNPQFGAGGERVVLDAHHGDARHRGLGEAIPSFYIFDTSTEVEAHQQFNLTSVFGVLGVPGRFGHPMARSSARSCFHERRRQARTLLAQLHVGIAGN
jgi:hypothetical protein